MYISVSFLKGDSNIEKNSVNSRLCIFFYFSHLTKRISKMVIKLFVILIFRRFFGRSAVSLIAIDKIFVKLDCCNCICTKYRIFLLFLSFFFLNFMFIINIRWMPLKKFRFFILNTDTEKNYFRDKENIVLAQKVHKVFLSCTYFLLYSFCMCGRRFLILQKK